MKVPSLFLDYLSPYQTKYIQLFQLHNKKEGEINGEKGGMEGKKGEDKNKCEKHHLQ